jgi:hypothetical protein
MVPGTDSDRRRGSWTLDRGPNDTGLNCSWVSNVHQFDFVEDVGPDVLQAVPPFTVQRRGGLDKRRMNRTTCKLLEFQGARQRARHGTQSSLVCKHPIHPRTERRAVRRGLFIACGAWLFHHGDTVERIGVSGENACFLRLECSTVKSRMQRPLAAARQRRGTVDFQLRSGPYDTDENAADAGNCHCESEFGKAGKDSYRASDDALRPSAWPPPRTSQTERVNRRRAEAKADIERNVNIKVSFLRVAATSAALVLLSLGGTSPALSGPPRTIAYTVLFFGLYWTTSWLAGLTESENDDIENEATTSFLEGGELLSAPARVALFCLPASVLSASLVATPNGGTSTLLSTIPTVAKEDAPMEGTALCVVAAIVLALTILDAIVSWTQRSLLGSPATTTEDNSRTQSEGQIEPQEAFWNAERKLLDRWDAEYLGRPPRPRTTSLDSDETDDL